jgi:hypothetical protein
MTPPSYISDEWQVLPTTNQSPNDVIALSNLKKNRASMHAPSKLLSSSLPSIHDIWIDGYQPRYNKGLASVEYEAFGSDAWGEEALVNTANAPHHFLAVALTNSRNHDHDYDQHENGHDHDDDERVVGYCCFKYKYRTEPDSDDDDDHYDVRTPSHVSVPSVLVVGL